MNNQGYEIPKEHTWRTLLGTLIQHSQERQRIADALDVNPITLVRWAKHEADPRPQSLQRLLTALPQQRSLLFMLIHQEFPNFAARAGVNEDDSDIIPSAFFTEVLARLTRSIHPGERWMLQDRILQQALTHLDPGENDLALILALCVPPTQGQPIRSQREMKGAGKPPWPGTFGTQSTFLGAEFLAGQALTECRRISSQGEQQGVHTEPKKMSGSICITPLHRDDRVAGTLIGIHPYPQAFSSNSLTLLEQYADLLTLTLTEEDFYPLSHIRLYVMPPPKLQKPSLASFQQRVLDLLLEAYHHQHLMTRKQAEHIAWQQIEEELVQLAYTLM